MRDEELPNYYFFLKEAENVFLQFLRHEIKSDTLLTQRLTQANLHVDVKRANQVLSLIHI